MSAIVHARRLAPRAASALFVVALALYLRHHARDAAPEALVRSSLAFTTLLLLSFMGWGSAVARLVAKDRRADLGLRATWGMGVCLAIGGFLVLSGSASRIALSFQVVVGLALLAVDAFLFARPVDRARELWAEVRANPWFFCGLVVVAALLCLQSVMAIYGKAEWAVADDGPAYTVFPKQLFESGTFDQPFSFRRMSAYGGQSYLQAFLLLVVRPERLYLFDRGLCTAVVLLLLLGTPRERLKVPRELLLLPMLVVVTLDNVRSNLASEMSGTVLVLGLYRTLRWEPVEEGTRALGSAALIALLGAGALTLRQNYAAPVVGMLVLTYAFAQLGMRGSWRDRVRALREPAIAAGFSLVALLPWALAAQRSCHSFAYPLVSGNYHSGLGFESKRKLLEQLGLLWDNVTYAMPIASIHGFVLAGLVVRERAARRPGKALLVGSLLGLLLLVWLAWKAYPNDYERYYFGFEVALACAISLACLEYAPEGGGDRVLPVTWPAAIVVVASLWQLQTVLKPIHDQLGPAFEQLKKEQQIARSKEESADDDYYRRLQAHVPAKATMLVMLDEPYRLDFGRNKIEILDFPGTVSPRAAMPTKDPAALATYLDGLGIRYLAFVRQQSSKHLYKRATWEARAKGWEGQPQHYMAGTVMDTMGEIETLASMRAKLYDQGDLVLIDLTKPVAE